MFLVLERLKLNSDLQKDENPKLLKRRISFRKNSSTFSKFFRKAIEIINENSGGHSASIITNNKNKGKNFKPK